MLNQIKICYSNIFYICIFSHHDCERNLVIQQCHDEKKNSDWLVLMQSVFCWQYYHQKSTISDDDVIHFNFMKTWCFTILNTVKRIFRKLLIFNMFNKMKQHFQSDNLMKHISMFTADIIEFVNLFCFSTYFINIDLSDCFVKLENFQNDELMKISDDFLNSENADLML